jgi:hypothetical protein
MKTEKRRNRREKGGSMNKDVKTYMRKEREVEF